MEEEKKEETSTEQVETVEENSAAEETPVVEEGTEETQEEQTEEPSKEEETKSDEEESEEKTETKPEDEFKDIDPKEVTNEEVNNILKDKGFDMAALQQEWNEKGEITAETREKLAEVGITNEIVDNYIEGQKARVERELDEISKCIGGREALNNIINWAKTNISDAEKVSISQVTDSNVMKIILKDLKNRMEEKEGIVPEGTVTGEGGQPPVEMFESQAQMFEAIRDPKYKTDEAYRAKVMKKIAASREAGIDLGIY